MYCSSPHSKTLQAPEKLLLGLNIRTQFDALILSSVHVVNHRQISQIEYRGKQQHKLKFTVKVRDYRSNDQNGQKAR